MAWNGALERHTARVNRYPDVLGRAVTLKKIRRTFGDPGRSKAERLLQRSLELELEAARAFRIRGFTDRERHYIYRTPRDRSAVRTDLAKLECTLAQMEPLTTPEHLRKFVAWMIDPAR